MNNTPNTNPHTPLPPITPGQARIGIFDSGYGGLTILRQIRQLLPQYDYIYLGDNARAPYGSHSFDIIYRYTLQAVQALFQQGCQLVILACNTASAKALRTIQQRDLPTLDPTRRVLGVIRPTVEAVGPLTHTPHRTPRHTRHRQLRLLHTRAAQTMPRHHRHLARMPHVGATRRKL